ncbi:MAG: transporter substrate-binding protein [Paenibacillus sp.]|nr:transporter substrate-binding protein [Paenibacillus sp.]
MSCRSRKRFTLSLCIALGMLAAGGCLSKGAGSDDEPSRPDGGRHRQESTLKLVRYEHPGQAVRTDTPVLREIYNRTGIRLQVEGVPQSNYKEKKQVLLGTNHVPDVILVEQGDIRQFAKTGIFLNISDYMEYAPHFRSMLDRYPEIKKLQIDGNLYGFPIIEQHAMTVSKAPMIRTDLLAKLNMPIPATFDDLYAVLKKLKEAYPDSTPWTSRGMGFLDAFAFGMGAGYGIYFDPDIGGGTYVYGNNKPEFKEVLAYLNRLYEEELIDPDFSVNTLQKWTEKLSSGKSFFYYDNNLFAANFNLVLQKNQPGAKLDLVPFMQNRKGKTRGYVFAEGWLTESYAISSKVKDPIAAVRFYDWLYSPEGTEVSNFGIAGETYELAGGEPRMLDSVIRNYKSAADPARAMQAETGTGYLALSPNVDSRPFMQVSDSAIVEWGERLENDPGFYRIPGVNPSFTDEENEKIKQIMSKLSPINGDVVKFIMGVRPLEEFDMFADALSRAGASELEYLYNAALARAGR